MDRDRRWDRSKLAWDAIVLGSGDRPKVSVSEAVRQRYQAGETDEFLKPMVFSDQPGPQICDGDVVFFFNFRADRARQLSQAFLFLDFSVFDLGKWPPVGYITMTAEYKRSQGPGAVRPR